MPEQSEHDKPENLVEESQELEKEAARSLQDAADSHASVEGFFAINDERPPEADTEQAGRREKDR